MIDANGNKIRSASDVVNLPFLLKEIQFFIKAFRKNTADPQALIVAGKLHAFLKANGKAAEITEALYTLEEYVVHTQSTDFLWELIYVRRLLAASEPSTLTGKKQQAFHRQKAAEFFTRIAQIRPSNFNRCAEVIEWVTAAIYSYAAQDRETTDTILTRMQGLFEAIEEVKTEKYFTCGEYLYREILRKKSKKQQSRNERYALLRKLIRYSRGLYEITQNSNSLSLLAASYCELFAFEEFCYEEEKENIHTLLAVLDKQITNGVVGLKLPRDVLYAKVNARKG